MIQPIDYQEKAVKKLRDTANELLELQGGKTIVFKAPTGSGKTVMMADFLKELVENRTDDVNFAIIWTAPRQLHDQSKERLEKHYTDSKALRCVSFADLIDRQINDREILFLNWESIRREDNIFIRENEQDMNITMIMQNTHDANRIVILVIDESHYAANTEISRGLIEMFNPKLTIEVSATPVISNANALIEVPREHVIDEGVIKKQIAINPGFKNTITNQTTEKITFTSDSAESTDDFVLRMAIQKREDLAQGFKEIKANINPLLLIQLPDKKQGQDDFKDEIVQLLKNKHKITIENGKLAIYLSEDKTNLENITRNDSEVEVMIFKQAIAIGWDCPRASILALFRDWQSFTFSTQTLGRILRMPELKHYENEELNLGFVFTNLDDLSILEDTAGSYLTLHYAKRSEKYQSIALRSVHSKRFREETRLDSNFIRDFLAAAEEQKLKNKVKIDVGDVNMGILSDGLVTDVDSHYEHLQVGEHVQRKQNVEDIQKLFDKFATNLLHPLFPEKRSVGRVKTAIHDFFRFKFPKQFPHTSTRAQIIALHPDNRQYFIDTMNRAIEIYTGRVGKGKKEIITTPVWEIQSFRTYSHNFNPKPKKKSIYQPYLESISASDPEKEFAKFIDEKLENVEWWFKNGEQDATAFAIPYFDEQGLETPFYVDWIIKFQDGQIGLFDTKSGLYAKDAKTRAVGLAAYIKAENKKGKKLYGGIIVPKDGSFRFNDSEKYDYSPDLMGWKILG